MTGKNNNTNLWVLVPAILAAVMVAGIFIFGDPDEFMSGSFTITILAVSIGYCLFAIWSMFSLNDKVIGDNREYKRTGMIIVILIFAFIMRIYVGMMITGYPTDMSCWTSWSADSAGNGLFKFYSTTTFCDYPPGYIFILHIVGSIGKIIGIEAGTEGYNLLLKIPSILADIAMAWILYRLCVKKLKPTMGLIIAFLYAVNPLVILDSAAWGQIDAVLMLAIAGYLLTLYKKNIIGASLFFTVGFLIKPQMLFFGPVLAVVFIKYISERGWGQAIKVFLISIFSSLALFAAAVIPFTGDKPWYWIFEKYMGTIGSYNYITLNSANIFGMFGLNWVPTDTVKLGLSLGIWGIIGLAATVILYFVLSFINRDNKNIFILTAMLMTGIYAFGLKMHERYIFPVIAILLIAYIYDNRKSILAKFIVMSTAVFINVAQVLALIHIPRKDLIFIVSSGLVVAAYIWITVFCFKDVIKSYRDSRVNLMEASDEAMGFSKPE